MRRTPFFLLILLVMITACAPASNPTPAPGSLDWSRSPDAAIVRLETVGSTGDPARDMNAFPMCSLFGDGYVLWVNPSINPEELLEDVLQEDTVQVFMQDIINSGFLEGAVSLDALPESPEARVKRLTVSLGGETYSRIPDATWTNEAFDLILDRCRHLSSTPVLYEPQAAWLIALPVDFSADAPRLPWVNFAADYPDVSLADLGPDTPEWVSGNLLKLAWRFARQAQLQITDGDQTYQFVVRVPYAQPDAPPPPAGSS